MRSLGISLIGVTKVEHRGESMWGVSVKKHFKYIKKKQQSSFQETEQILESINKEKKKKSTSRCRIAEHKDKKKADNLHGEKRQIF